MSKNDSAIYHKIRYRLFYLHFVLTFLVLAIFVMSGLSVSLRSFSASFSSSLWISRAIYIFLFSLMMFVFNLPFSFFEGFAWEHKFNLSTQTFLGWIFDESKKMMLAGIMGIVVVELLYVFLDWMPQVWWMAAGGSYLLLTLFLARITPNVIIPMFYKYSSIEDPALKESVLQIFRKAKVQIKDAYLINLSSKTKKANAFICGLGKSRRVVLSDTLVADFSIPEIEAVLAHEIGHFKNKDILKLTLLNSCVTMFGFFAMSRILRKVLPWTNISQINDIAFFPVVLLTFSAFGFCLMPLLNSYSRSIERRADLFSLNLTGRPQDFIQMISRLGERNLAEFTPNRFNEIFFYDHPPIAKRIEFAQKYHSIKSAA